jgi:hypothetical protein
MVGRIAPETNGLQRRITALTVRIHRANSFRRGAQGSSRLEPEICSHGTPDEHYFMLRETNLVET